MTVKYWKASETMTKFNLKKKLYSKELSLKTQNQLKTYCLFLANFEHICLKKIRSSRNVFSSSSYTAFICSSESLGGGGGGANFNSSISINLSRMWMTNTSIFFRNYNIQDNSSLTY